MAAKDAALHAHCALCVAVLTIPAELAAAATTESAAAGAVAVARQVHALSCPARTVACACGVAMPASALEAHADGCAAVTRPCAYCALPFTRAAVDAHEVRCGSRTAACEQCHRLVVVKAMPSHVCGASAGSGAGVATPVAAAAPPKTAGSGKLKK